MKIRIDPQANDIATIIEITMIEEGEEGEVVGEATVSCEGVPFERAWQLTYIEVDDQYRRQGIATQLYHCAKAYVRERGCRLLPHPDLLWDGFFFWMKLDPDALLEVLSHHTSRGIVQRAGGDEERLLDQLALVRKCFALRLILTSRQSPSDHL